MLLIVSSHSGKEANGFPFNQTVTIEVRTGTRNDLLDASLKAQMAGVVIAGMVLLMPAMWVSLVSGSPMAAPSVATNAMDKVPIQIPSAAAAVA